MGGEEQQPPWDVKTAREGFGLINELSEPLESIDHAPQRPELACPWDIAALAVLGPAIASSVSMRSDVD
ncbi:uncharacterized protein A4U43_C08F21810 [Asparagus officinalis]|nr:uncharacterized protein A4U43_C08F21810 [Asparagus officinalis]